MTNTLYYGDNLDILRQHVPDESVDLVYLDPPFNSNANYNVLFKEQSGEASPAQIRAFTDTWEWTLEAERTYEQEIITNPGTPANVKEMVSAFRQFIGSNAMMAYLVMMTPQGPDYDATISFGLPFELGDCPYGKSRLNDPELFGRTIRRSYGSLTIVVYAILQRPIHPAALRAF